MIKVTTDILNGALFVESDNKDKYISLLMGAKLLLILCSKNLSINARCVFVNIK
jgi:hypothetical protein